MNCIPFGILFDLVTFTFTINMNYIVATFTYKLLCMTDSEVYVTKYNKMSLNTAMSYPQLFRSSEVLF